MSHPVIYTERSEIYDAAHPIIRCRLANGFHEFYGTDNHKEAAAWFAANCDRLGAGVLIRKSETGEVMSEREKDEYYFLTWAEIQIVGAPVV